MPSVKAFVQDAVVASGDPVPAEAPDPGLYPFPEYPRVIHVIHAQAVTHDAGEQRLFSVLAELLVLQLELFDISPRPFAGRRFFANNAADHGRMVEELAPPRDDRNALLREDVNHLLSKGVIPHDRVEVAAIECLRDQRHVVRVGPLGLVPGAHGYRRGIQGERWSWLDCGRGKDRGKDSPH